MRRPQRAISLLSIVAVLAATLLSTVPPASVSQAKGEDVCPEPNDDFQAACYLGPGSDALGFISSADDLDAYRFESLDFNVKAHVEIADEPLPYQFVVANWNGDPIATSSTVGTTEVAELTLPLPGSYYVFVQSRTGEFSDSAPYRILTRLNYATLPAPRAVYRGDFRAGSNDYDAPVGHAEFVRSEGKVSIKSTAAGTPQEPEGGTLWLDSLPEQFVLTLDSRNVQGTNAGYLIRFAAQEPTTGPLHDQFVLSIDPNKQLVAFGQFVGTVAKLLVPWQPAPAIYNDGRVNRTVLMSDGGQVKVNINGTEVLSWAGAVPAGRFAVGSLVWGDATSVSFDNVMGTAPDTKPTAGAVLFSENFDDPGAARLTTTSPTPNEYIRGYDGGEYFIRILQIGDGRTSSAILPDEYDNSSMAVDAHDSQASPTHYFWLTCRFNQISPDVWGSYVAAVYPETGRVGIRRIRFGANPVPLIDQVSPAMKHGTEVNHIEMTCSGSTISVSINGTPAASVEDSTYKRGFSFIGVGALPGGPPYVEARFDNLVVTQR